MKTQKCDESCDVWDIEGVSGIEIEYIVCMDTVAVLWLVFINNPRAVDNPLEVVLALWHVDLGNPALFVVIPHSIDWLPVSERACETHAVVTSAVGPLQLKRVCG